jgi:hypothetical protein
MKRRNFMRFFEAKAYGLHETRNPLFPQKEPRARHWPMFVIAGVVILSCILLVALLFGPYLRLETISITGAATLPPEDLSATLKQELDTRRWLILPNSHRWFYDEEGSEAALMEAYPLKGAHIQTRGGVVEADIVEDIFLVGLNTGEQTLVLNTSGEILATEVALPPGAPLIKDKTAVAREPGDIVFTPEVIHGVITFQEGLQGQNIEPSEFVSDDPALPWFTVTSNKEYVILFDATRDIQEQLLLLKTVVDEYLTTQESPRYIDVRFGTRVYVR